MSNEITVLDYRPLRRGESLQGFATLRLASGLILHDCAYHRRADGSRWIGMPSRQFTKTDGSTSYVRIVEFDSKETAARFQNAAKAALDAYFAAHDSGGNHDDGASRQRCEDAAHNIQQANREADRRGINGKAVR